MNTKQQVLSIMVKDNTSFASAVLKITPELMIEEKDIKLTQSSDDIEILKYIKEGKTPSNILLRDAAKQLNIPENVLRKIIMGRSLYLAKRQENKRLARQGDLKNRVQLLDSYIEEHIQPLSPYPYKKNTANALNSLLKLYDHSAEDRINDLLKENSLTSNQLAWFLFDVNSFNINYLNGVSAFVRKELKNHYGIKIKVFASKTEDNTLSALFDEKSNSIFITINKDISPLNFFNSDIFEQIDIALNAHYISLGFKHGIKDYVESLADNSFYKKNKIKFNRLLRSEGYLSALKFFHSIEEISTNLDLANRYAKDKKNSSFHTKISIYQIKNRLLIEAYHSGEAVITKLIHRPNPFMFSDSKLISNEKIVSLLEELYLLGLAGDSEKTPKVKNLFNHLQSKNIISIDNFTITHLVTEDIYINNVMDLINNNKQVTLCENICNLLSYSSLAFKFIEAFPFSPTKNYNRDTVLKYFSCDYTHLWEIELGGNVFHLPVSKFTPNNANDIDVIYMDWMVIRGEELSESELLDHPLEKVLSRLFLKR